MRVSAIVPAAGSGERLAGMNGRRYPKQFWQLGQHSILERILVTLHESPVIREIIVACAPQHRTFCQREVVGKNKLAKVKKIVAGGRTRADSVYNCLRAVGRGTTHVLVQDGVRPFLSPRLIAGLAQRIGTADGIIAARPVVPTLKKVINDSIVATVDRRSLWEAETPQLFKKKMLVEAFRHYRQQKQTFTDDASLVELYGGRVKVYDPQSVNIKITTPADYAVARKLVDRTIMRVGIGYDIHRLVAGRQLIIGGVRIPSRKGCLGHSDGDPLLHAIVDALLGALALGDIGEHFPDTEPAYKNVSSRTITVRVMKMVRALRYRVVHVDSTVILERPRLRRFKQKIKKQVAQLLAVSPYEVSIKAKTNEGLDSEGSGCSISAHAVVMLEKE